MHLADYIRLQPNSKAAKRDPCYAHDHPLQSSCSLQPSRPVVRRRTRRIERWSRENRAASSAGFAGIEATVTSRKQAMPNWKISYSKLFRMLVLKLGQMRGVPSIVFSCGSCAGEFYIFLSLRHLPELHLSWNSGKPWTRRLRRIFHLNCEAFPGGLILSVGLPSCSWPPVPAFGPARSCASRWRKAAARTASSASLIQKRKDPGSLLLLTRICTLSDLYRLVLLNCRHLVNSGELETANRVLISVRGICANGDDKHARILG